ncbi:MAG: hypothetical protein RL017_369 [Pseudomonadota bacterium]|jgi:hypothetical protein
MKLQRLSVQFKLQHVFYLSVILWIIMAITGCATLYGQNEHSINIDSYPHAADVYMNGVLYGRTPATVVLPRVNYQPTTIILKKYGYLSHTLQIPSQIQSVAYWDTLFPPFYLVDVGTGCLFKIKDGNTNFNIQLESSSQ